MRQDNPIVADIMTIGENIKKARETSGLTQLDVHLATGIPLATYKAYEAGSRPPPGDRIATIAKALKVSTDELLFEPQDREVNQELRVMFQRISGLPDDLRGQTKTMLRAMILGMEEEASKRDGHAA